MKLIPKKTALLAIIALLVSTTASAAYFGSCSLCFSQYRQCLRAGGDQYTCYDNYEICLYSNGCMVP
jgi:hypothetical protein